ncbi:hypothetical protein CEK25_006561 [Fusarium fujikuroi]|nr:hypothetical protein CEK25_006561 [Fusarium fujikuroi]
MSIIDTHLVALEDEKAQDPPYAEALEDETWALTYAELDCVTTVLAARSRDYGVGRADYVAALATLRAGCVLGALATLLASCEILVIEDAKPTVILTHVIEYSKPTGNLTQVAVVFFDLGDASTDLIRGARVAIPDHASYDPLRPLVRASTTGAITDTLSSYTFATVLSLILSWESDCLIFATLWATVVTTDLVLAVRWPLPDTRLLNGEVVTTVLARPTMTAVGDTRLQNLCRLCETHESRLESAIRVGRVTVSRGYTVKPGAVWRDIRLLLTVRDCEVVAHGEGLEIETIPLVVRDMAEPRDRPIALTDQSRYSPSVWVELTEELAYYMIPSGKVDLKALPAHGISGPVNTEARLQFRPGWLHSLALVMTLLAAFFDLWLSSFALAPLAGRLSRDIGFSAIKAARDGTPTAAVQASDLPAVLRADSAEVQGNGTPMLRSDSILPGVTLGAFTPKNLVTDAQIILVPGVTVHPGARIRKNLIDSTDSGRIYLLRFPERIEICAPAGMALTRKNVIGLAPWEDYVFERIEILATTCTAVMDVDDGQTKWVAENGLSTRRAVVVFNEASRRGIPLELYRSGSVSGHNAWDLINAFSSSPSNLVARLHVEGWYIVDPWTLSATPVTLANHTNDTLADHTIDGDPAPFPLGDPICIPSQELWATPLRLGYPTGTLWWEKRVTERLATILNRKTVDIPSAVDMPSVEVLSVIVLKEDTVLTLDKYDVPRPKMNDGLLEIYMRHFYARGWLSRPPRRRTSQRRRQEVKGVLQKCRKVHLAGIGAAVAAASRQIGAAVAARRTEEGAQEEVASRGKVLIQGVKTDVSE